MTTRSMTKQGISTDLPSSPCEEENASEEANKMALDQAALSTVDVALVLQEIQVRQRNQALSNRMDIRTAEINESISGLRAMLDGLTSRVTDAEDRIGATEDQLANMSAELQKLTKDNTFLLDKVESLENYSRRNNIRIVNLREGCEGSDPVAFFANWLPNILGCDYFAKPLVIERAHRTLAPKPSAGEKPRAVLIRFLSYQDRENVLCIAANLTKANKSPILFEDEPVMFFPDLSAGLVKRRKEYNQVKKKLRSMGIEYSLLHPATLRIKLPDGSWKFFKTLKDADVFVVNTLGK
ncbi:unnamed protein product [Knipowitschia caucasica]